MLYTLGRIVSAVSLAELSTSGSGWLMDETQPFLGAAWLFRTSTFKNLCQIGGVDDVPLTWGAMPRRVGVARPCERKSNLRIASNPS